MSLLFEGAIAVKAAMLSGNRDVEEIIIDYKRKDKDCAFIKRQAENRGVKVTLKSREEIDGLAEKSTHGGIIAYVGERKYQSLEDVFTKEHPFLCILEGIEDPYNFAYLLRSLYAAGCDGVIVGERNWSSAGDVIAKGSAGAGEYIPIIVSKDFGETIKELKEHGVKLYTAMRSDEAIPYFDADYRSGCCIAIGGEMRGLSKDVLKATDQDIYIPYNSNFRNSLTASSAGAILAFEVNKQRFVR